MKTIRYLISLGIAIVLVFVSQFVLTEPGSDFCMNNPLADCESYTDYFNKYGWPFAFKWANTEKTEYLPKMFVIDIILVAALIILIWTGTTRIMQKRERK